MLIQNVSSAASAPGFTGDSGPVPVAASGIQSAPAALAQAAKATQQPIQPTDAQLKNAVSNINSAMKESNINIEFSIDQGTKETVIKVLDSQTGQLVTQFPSKAMLAISQMIEQEQPGALIEQKA